MSGPNVTSLDELRYWLKHLAPNVSHSVEGRLLCVPERLLHDLIEDSVEMNSLFELQWTRMREATDLWRHHNPGNDLVMPDLGKLLTWLMEQMEP